MTTALLIYFGGTLVVAFGIGLMNDPDETDYAGALILALCWPFAAANFVGAAARTVLQAVHSRIFLGSDNA